MTKVLGGRAEPGQVVFYDDFDEFDESVWRHDRYLTVRLLLYLFPLILKMIFLNNCLWLQTDGFVIYGSNVNNSYVDDGILFIEPTFTADHFNESFLSFGRLTVGRTIEKRWFYRQIKSIIQSNAFVWLYTWPAAVHHFISRNVRRARIERHTRYWIPLCPHQSGPVSRSLFNMASWSSEPKCLPVTGFLPVRASIHSLSAYK